MNLTDKMPPYYTDNELTKKLSVLPEIKPDDTSKQSRLLNLLSVYDLFIPTNMAREIYSTVYFALVRSLNRKSKLYDTYKMNDNRKVINGRGITSGINGGDCSLIVGDSGVGKSQSIARAVSIISENSVIETENPLLFGEKGNLNEPNCRSFFKLMFMRLYFGGDAKRIAKGILKKEKRAEGIEIHKENELAKKEKRVPNFISVVKPFCEYEKKGFSLEELIEKWQKPLVKIIGANDNDKKTEVFLDESCIYLLVNKRLRDMGIDFVQVYDGFYFPKKTLNSVDNPNGIDLEKIINEAKEEYVLLVEKLILEQYNESVDKMIGIYH